MKRRIVIYLILFTQVCISQTYLEIPDSNAKWINIHSTFTGGPFIPKWQIQFCATGNDTVINLKSYFRIDTCNVGYKGALRNESGKVYFVPKDSIKEFILYDFTVNEGDSLLNVYIESPQGYASLYDLYVDSGAVDSISIDGVYHKRINFGFGGLGWIEGVGNGQGLFWEPWGNISGYALELYCLSENDSTLFPDSGFGACENTLGLIEDLSVNNEIMIYPNPTSKEFRLNVDFQFQELFIIDSKGIKVFSSKNVSNNSVIEFDSFPNGVYLIVIRSNDQTMTKKLIKK